MCVCKRSVGVLVFILFVQHNMLQCREIPSKFSTIFFNRKFFLLVCAAIHFFSFFVSNVKHVCNRHHCCTLLGDAVARIVKQKLYVHVWTDIILFVFLFFAHSPPLKMWSHMWLKCMAVPMYTIHIIHNFFLLCVCTRGHIFYKLWIVCESSFSLLCFLFFLFVQSVLYALSERVNSNVDDKRSTKKMQ